MGLKKSLILKLFSIFYYASPALSMHKRDSIFDLVDLIRSKTYFLCKRTFQVEEAVLLDLKKSLILKLLSIFYYASPALSMHKRDYLRPGEPDLIQNLLLLLEDLSGRGGSPFGPEKVTDFKAVVYFLLCIPST